jgi:hypothetical protein
MRAGRHQEAVVERTLLSRLTAHRAASQLDLHRQHVCARRSPLVAAPKLTMVVNRPATQQIRP